MKFKKVQYIPFFSKYVREDGKYTIISKDRNINGSLKSVFVVYDEQEKEIDALSKLKDAKEKYSK